MRLRLSDRAIKLVRGLNPGISLVGMDAVEVARHTISRKRRLVAATLALERCLYSGAAQCAGRVGTDAMRTVKCVINVGMWCDAHSTHARHQPPTVSRQSNQTRPQINANTIMSEGGERLYLTMPDNYRALLFILICAHT